MPKRLRHRARNPGNRPPVAVQPSSLPLALGLMRSHLRTGRRDAGALVLQVLVDRLGRRRRGVRILRAVPGRLHRACTHRVLLGREPLRWGAMRPERLFQERMELRSLRPQRACRRGLQRLPSGLARRDVRRHAIRYAQRHGRHSLGSGARCRAAPGSLETGN